MLMNKFIFKLQVRVKLNGFIAALWLHLRAASTKNLGAKKSLFCTCNNSLFFYTWALHISYIYVTEIITLKNVMTIQPQTAINLIEVFYNTPT